MFRHALCRIDDAHVAALRTRFVAQNGDFLLPRDYANHPHQWVAIAMGVRLCRLCGAEHVCFRGQCEEEANESGERVCVLSGCVTTIYNMRDERDAPSRSYTPSAAARHKPPARCPHLYDIVSAVVEEILMSRKTALCMAEEAKRQVIYCSLYGLSAARSMG